MSRWIELELELEINPGIAARIVLPWATSFPVEECSVSSHEPLHRGGNTPIEGSEGEVSVLLGQLKKLDPISRDYTQLVRDLLQHASAIGGVEAQEVINILDQVRPEIISFFLKPTPSRPRLSLLSRSQRRDSFPTGNLALSTCIT